MGFCYDVPTDVVEKVDYGLPQDVVNEILSRLPVKSLLRLRCVCKFWCALTNDPCFITKHWKQQEARDKKNGSLFVHNYDRYSKKYVLSLCPNENLGLPSYQYPGLNLNSETMVLGPCNGIFGLFNTWEAVALWNPAMRQFRTLPILPLPDLPPVMEVSHNVFGFGLDPKTNDYKVISIRVFVNKYEDDRDFEMGTKRYNYKQVGVFTLSSDSWRELDGNLVPAHIVCSSSFYSYADGFYYWFAHDNSNNLILAFDMADEVFLAKPEPDILPELEVEESWRRYAFYDDSIACIVYNLDDGERFYSIWVLKEDCWTKQVTIGPLLGVDNPLGFWKDGGLLLKSRTTAELVVSDPITGEIKEVGIEDPIRVFVYCESLVSVERGNERGK